MNEVNSSNDKIKSLFKYLASISKIRNKIITNDENYIWKYRIEDIPIDEENISVLYCDDNENYDNYILCVHKPEFQKVPNPPEELKKGY